MTRFLGVVALLLRGGVFPTEALNTPLPKPVCDPSKTVSVRYSSSSRRIYIESSDPCVQNFKVSPLKTA